MINAEQLLVSIITPCFNVEKFIGEYLDSVLAQTYDNIELILVDDGSTDRTKEIIDSYISKIKNRGYTFHYIYQNHSGQASALNKGLAIFNGYYFTWPDADDILSKNNIKLKVNFLKNNPQYSLVRGKRQFFEKDITKPYELDNTITFENEDIFFDLFLEKTFANGGCYLMKRDLFLKCYPEIAIYQGLGSQNWQLLVPAASRSKCGNINEVIYYMREHPDSFSRRKRSLHELLARFDDHKNILFDSFLHSDCDIEFCRKIVEEKYARKKFFYAFKYNNKDVVVQQYKILKKMNKLNSKEILKYLTMKNKTIYDFYNKLRQIKRATFYLTKGT